MFFKKIGVLLLGLMVFNLSAQAQDRKIEREKRIKREDVPQKMLQFIDSLTPQSHKRLRFYFQTDGDHKSYEAKFNYKKHHFSVAFEESGTLYDVEVQQKEKELPKQVLQNITQYIKKHNERFRIEKIQEQYIIPKYGGDAVIYKNALQFNPPDNYELIVAVKNKGKLKRYEIIFDAHGQFSHQREVIRNSYDYLIF